MKKWAEENKKPDGSDYDIYKDGLKSTLQLIPECSCMLKKPFLPMANLQEEFSINQRIIKRSFCQQPL
jgi:penicillin-binding protein 1A